MRCMVSDVILLGCSTSVSSEVIFESIMDAEMSIICTIIP